MDDPTSSRGSCLCGEVRFVLTVRLGVLDGAPSVGPQYHSFDADRAPWEPPCDDGLPRYPGAPPPA